MEGAVRIFAGELNRSTMTVPGEDGSAAWVVSPSGAVCREVFLAGALVEVNEQGGMLSARVADPTGGFDLACSANAPAIAGVIRQIPLPSFVSVAGRTQLFRRDGSTAVTVRPELVQVIHRRTRDGWIVTTASATLERLEEMHRALAGSGTDPRSARVRTHYGVIERDLDELAQMAVTALSTVRQAAGPSAPQADPRELILGFIRAAPGPKGVAVQDIIDMAGGQGISREGALAAVESLIVEDECYQPQKGFVRVL